MQSVYFWQSNTKDISIGPLTLRYMEPSETIVACRHRFLQKEMCFILHILIWKYAIRFYNFHKELCVLYTQYFLILG